MLIRSIFILGLFCFSAVQAGPPQRRTLQFEYPPGYLEKLSPSQRNTAEYLKRRIQEELWLWSNFEIEVPRPVLADEAQVQMGGFFLVDAAEHVKRLAFDENGTRIYLNDQQLSELRHKAIFHVADPKNPGQYDVWKAKSRFIKGTDNITISLKDSLAKGMEHVVITFPQAMFGNDSKSIKMRVANMLYGIRNSISLLVGLPEMKRKFSAAEVEEILAEARAEKAGRAMASVHPGLSDPEIMKKALPIIQEIWKHVDTEWPALARTEQIRLQNGLQQGLSASEHAQWVSDQLQGSLQMLFFKKLKESDALNQLSPGLSEAVARQGLVLSFLEHGRFEIARAMRDRQNYWNGEIRADHPILGRIDKWREGHAKYYSDLEFVAIRNKILHQVADRLGKAGLKDEERAVRAIVPYITEDEPDARQTLESEQVAARKYEHKYLIWRQQNWIRTKVKNAQGEEEWVGTKWGALPDVYTSWYGWRLFNFAERWYTQMSYGLHWLVNTNLWNGPLGLRSLFGSEPFPVAFIVDPKTGKIIEDPSHTRMGTMTSRVQAVHQSVDEARARFEAAPDTGMISKAVVRPFHIFWHRFMRQLFQPPALIAGQVAGTVVNTAATGFALRYSPVLAAAGAAVPNAVNPLVHDYEAPREDGSAGSIATPKVTGTGFPLFQQLFRRVFAEAIPATLTSLKTALWDLTTVPAFHWTKGAGQFVAENARDLAVRNTLWALSWAGTNRVPARDPDFLASRIQGYGVAGKYIHRLDATTALAGLIDQMELEELQVYRDHVLDMLAMPEAAAREFFVPMAQLMSASGAVHFTDNSDVVGQMRKFYQEKARALDHAVAERQKKIEARLPKTTGAFRLSKEELDKAIIEGAAVMANYYDLRTFGEVTDARLAAYWKSQGLVEGDWVGLTRKLLAKEWGEGVLIPMEKTEASFIVDSQPAQAREMVASFIQGGNLFVEDHQRAIYDSKAVVNPKPSMPLINADHFCANMLSVYGRGVVTRDELPSLD